jgi:hypothetical protein
MSRRSIVDALGPWSRTASIWQCRADLGEFGPAIIRYTSIARKNGPGELVHRRALFVFYPSILD